MLFLLFLSGLSLLFKLLSERVDVLFQALVVFLAQLFFLRLSASAIAGVRQHRLNQGWIFLPHRLKQGFLLLFCLLDLGFTLLRFSLVITG